jgi:hypothetical protein
MPAVQLIVSTGQNRVRPITELVRNVVQETGLVKKKKKYSRHLRALLLDPNLVFLDPDPTSTLISEADAYIGHYR